MKVEGAGKLLLWTYKSQPNLSLEVEMSIVKLVYYVSRLHRHHQIWWDILSFVIYSKKCLRIYVLINLILIINRPGVVGAVLQTLLSLIDWLSDPFPQTTSLPNRKS